MLHFDLNPEKYDIPESLEHKLSKFWDFHRQNIIPLISGFPLHRYLCIGS